MLVCGMDFCNYFGSSWWALVNKVMFKIRSIGVLLWLSYSSVVRCCKHGNWYAMVHWCAVVNTVMVSNIGGLYGNLLGKPPVVFTVKQAAFVQCNTTQHNTSHHITSHHITSHHIISYHITSHHITSHHITSHHITSYHIILYYIILYYHCVTVAYSIEYSNMLYRFVA